MFETFVPAEPDKILGIMETLRQDPRPLKVDLGVGVYRDERGTTPVFTAVREAQRRVIEHEQTKSYIGLEGDLAFNAAIIRLALGSSLPLARVRACQAAGGSGAVRILADLLHRARPGATVWLPRPTWPNHQPLMRSAGFRTAEYPYYDVPSGSLLFDDAIAALEAAAPSDIVLLHGCCQNPSGADLTSTQWECIADLVARRRLFPLIDIAYQGFGEGLEADAAGLRLIVAQVPEAAIAFSCSKNFGVYRDRVGCAIVVAEDARRADVTLSQLSNVVRTGHSMPSGHGAAVVRSVLDDVHLAKEWRAELEQMRTRMILMREALSAALRVRTNATGYDFISRQRGLFSLLNATPAQVHELRAAHGVYLVDDGRINVAGLIAERVDHVADALIAVCHRSA